MGAGGRRTGVHGELGGTEGKCTRELGERRAGRCTTWGSWLKPTATLEAIPATPWECSHLGVASTDSSL